MAFWIFVQLGLLALSLVASHYLAPKAGDDQALKASTLGDFKFPRAEEGDVVPIAYGTVRIRSPIVIRVDDFASSEVIAHIEGDPLFGLGASDQVIGHRYSLTMRLLLCRGNSPLSATTGGAELIALLIGDNVVGRGQLFGPLADIPNSAGSESFLFSDPEAFAGEIGYGSYSTLGTMYFYKGRWDQERHRSDIISEDLTVPAPPYRGQVVATFLHWNIGTASTIPAYSVVIHNPVTIPGYEAITAPIGEVAATANPAAVLYDILTNPWGGVGSPESSIDLDSFAAVAATLAAEQHGMSFTIQRASDARGIIEQILRQIDGVLYEDPATRKYVLALIREDYVVNDLFVASVSNVDGDPELSSSLWEETVNEVRVVYTVPERGFIDGTASAQDLANVNSQGGRRRSAEFRFLGVSDPSLASTLATRELNFLSRPIMKLKITLNRTAGALRPGDPFVFSWPSWNLEGVFRVLEIDNGTLEDGRVSVTAVQDRFAIPGALLEVPEDEVSQSTRDPLPIEWRAITEAPRWIQLKAFDAGDLANVDAQRGYYLATPEGDDTRYRVELDTGLDAPGRAFPGGFTIDADYARSVGPYDTVTGLYVRDVRGTLAAASATEISTLGRNLIQIGGEILAFEGVTDLGGGDYRLTNVWRGVLDTVPADHVAGERGYLLPGTYARAAMGSSTLVHGDAHTATTLAAVGASWTLASESPTDDFVVRSRVLLPYPGAAVKVNSSQTPAPLVEGGVTLDWRDRRNVQATITRQDVADETLPVGQTFDAVAYKGDGPQDGGTQIVLAANHTSHTAIVPVGGAGHGVLELGVDTRLAVTLPDATTPTLSGWQVPTLPVLAHHWRNLLINPRFDVGIFTNWTVGSGSASQVSGGLGGGGKYMTGVAGAGDTEIHQRIPLAGYQPGGLTAILDFHAASGGDADDTLTVVLTSLDASDMALDTATYGPAVQNSDYRKQTLAISDLDPATVALGVSVTIASVGDIDATANTRVAELVLRAGQISAQLLTNPSLDASTTGWTETVGTWQILTGPAYDSAGWARPNNGASAQLRQAASIPTGHQYGAAVLEFARINDDASDTGEVTLAALDGGGSVLSSVTTGAEAITPTSAWQRRRLVLDPIPAGATQLRVQLDATRVSGTPLNSGFDAFDLRTHKHLDPDVAITRTFDAPVTQRLPRTRGEWRSAFPTVVVPNYALFAGGNVGSLGVEPLLEPAVFAARIGKCVVNEGRSDDRRSTDCYEMDRSGGYQTSGIGVEFGNFSNRIAWSVLVFYRPGEATFGGACALASRVVEGAGPEAGIGWLLGLNASGLPFLRLFGASDGDVITGAAPASYGDLAAIGVTYDPVTYTATLVDVAGSTDLDASAFGTFRTETPSRFRIGAGDTYDAFPGQIPRVYVWRGVGTPDAVALQSLLTCATLPSGLTDPHPRTGPIACVTGSDAAGVLVELAGPGRIAHVDTGDGLGFGLVSMPALVNLAPASFADVGWSTAGGTVTDAVGSDPSGFRAACRIDGTSSQGRRLGALALGTAGTRSLSFFARAEIAGNAQVVLESNTPTTVATYTIALTTAWQLYEVALAWTGTTGGVGRLRFAASTTGTARTMDLAPLLYVGTGSPATGSFPIGSPGASCPSLGIAPTAQWNAEGELAADVRITQSVDGTLVRAHNGANDNDARSLRFDSNDLIGGHATSTGANTNATATLTTIDAGETFTGRLRWNRAALVDGAGSEYTSVRGEQGGNLEAAGGRVAVWTASGVALTTIDLGHDDGADVTAAAIYEVRVRAREPKIG